MRLSILILSIIATMGLCTGGTCALAIADDKDNDSVFPPIVSSAAYAAIVLVWAGAVFSWRRRARIGRWILVGAVALAWTAFVIGFGVAVDIGNKYSGTPFPLMVWFFTFLIPGVIPATFAMSLAFNVNPDNRRDESQSGQ